MRHHDELAKLHQEAQRACEDGESTLDFEPALAALLDFIKASPECREAASRLFIQQVRGAGGGVEMLEYCMHELRWSEVRDAARARIAESDDWRIKTPLSDVLAAFEDGWVDADMYCRWQQPPSR
ncbi:MAG: hypothetical protein ACI9VR_001703 [Cognaticolwellia sp.]|jgi:hypothetical protein